MSDGGLYRHDMAINPNTGYPVIAWVEDDSTIHARVWSLDGTVFENPLDTIDGAEGMGAVDIAIDVNVSGVPFIAFHDADGIIGVTFIDDGINTLATTEGEAPLGPGTGALIDILCHTDNGGTVVADYAIDGARVFFFFESMWTQLGSDGDIEALGGGLPEGSLATFPPKLWNDGPVLYGLFTYWAEGIGMTYRLVTWDGEAWSLVTTDDDWCTGNGTAVSAAFSANHVLGDGETIVMARETSDGAGASLVRVFYADDGGWVRDPAEENLANLEEIENNPLVAAGSLSISQQEDTGQMIVVYASTDGDVYAKVSNGFFGENDGWTPLGRRAGIIANIAGGTESLEAQYPIVMWELPGERPLYAWILLRTTAGKLQARRILMSA